MPTGYTAHVNDGTITTLKDYALTCARAFGALIELRDEPSGLAPRRLPVADSYHKERLTQAKDELERLQNMTDEQRVAACNAYNAENSKARQEAIERNAAIRDHYNAMLDKIAQWKAPSPDHVELRQFMIDQILESRRFDVTDNPGKWIPEPVAVDAWYAEAIRNAERDVAYHTEKLAEDQKRSADRQAWLDQLWEAFPE